MIAYGPFLGQIPLRLGQTLGPQEQDAYYRKLAQYLASASDIQKFAGDHPTEAKAFGLDQTAGQIGDMVGGFSSLEWAAIAGTLRTGTATANEAKRVDDLGALIVPAQQKLIEAQKIVASKPAPSSNVPWIIGAVLVSGFAVSELTGLTHVTGVRKQRR